MKTENKIIPKSSEPLIPSTLYKDNIVEISRSLEILADKIHNLTHELTNCNKILYNKHSKDRQRYKLMQSVIVTDIEIDVDDFRTELLQLRHFMNRQ